MAHCWGVNSAHSDKSFIVGNPAFHENAVGTGRTSATDNRHNNRNIRGYSYYDNNLHEFFFKPSLEFTNISLHTLVDMRWGKLNDNGDSFYPNRRFVKVTVRNNGKRHASNCEVKLTVCRKVNGCIWLSTSDTKILVWENGKTEATIKNKPDTCEFCLAFSQERLTRETSQLIDPVYCGLRNQKIKCIAWVGTERALQRTGYADQDGMCHGEFVVRAEVVMMDTGKTISRNFRITVEDTWRNLTAEMLDEPINETTHHKIFELFRLKHTRKSFQTPTTG